MRRAATLAVTVALAAGSGCGESDETRHELNPTGTITAAQDSTLDIAFDVNPGVGFGWELAGKPKGPVLSYEGTETEGVDQPGAPGTQHFRFDAREVGRAKLVFLHDYRGKTIERRTVTVIVS